MTMQIEKQKPVVSVFCAVFNHELFLRQTLESFVSQKTDFPFEVIVHDDASTDNSKQIIVEFAEKYPQIIKPIYQKDNQYSKGKYIIGDYMLPVAQGDYFAWCEGDDYWTDEFKLQKQVNALKEHPDCYFCTHVVPIDHNGTIEGRFPSKSVNTGVYSAEAALELGYFQTSSFLVNADHFRSYIKFKAGNPAIWGSESLQMYMKLVGNMYFINEEMSMYRIMTPGSWTSTQSQNKKKQITNRLRFLSMLNAFYVFSEGKYKQFFVRRINEDVVNYLYLNDPEKQLTHQEYKFVFQYLTIQSKIKFWIWRICPQFYFWLINQ